MIDLAVQLIFREEKMQSIGSLQQFLNNINTVKRLQKTLKYKHYKNLIMTIDDEKKNEKNKV